jgi:hypothetical protein
MSEPASSSQNRIEVEAVAGLKKAKKVKLELPDQVGAFSKWKADPFINWAHGRSTAPVAADASMANARLSKGYERGLQFIRLNEERDRLLTPIQKAEIKQRSEAKRLENKAFNKSKGVPDFAATYNTLLANPVLGTAFASIGDLVMKNFNGYFDKKGILFTDMGEAGPKLSEVRRYLPPGQNRHLYTIFTAMQKLKRAVNSYESFLKRPAPTGEDAAMFFHSRKKAFIKNNIEKGYLDAASHKNIVKDNLIVSSNKRLSTIVKNWGERTAFFNQE